MAFARQSAQDMSYEAILAPLDGFVRMLQDFFGGGGSGVLRGLLYFFALVLIVVGAATIARFVRSRPIVSQEVRGGD
jgi:hypothetical protein